MDIMCLSETWERVEQPLASVLGLDGYEIISNPFCRTNRGGRPAIIINSSKFNVQNLSQTEIPTEWKTECVWAMVSLKNTTNSSRIKKIIIASYYIQPGIKRRKKFYDYLSNTFHSLKSKHGDSVFYAFCGDTNQLNLSPIISLSPDFKQVVQTPTRADKILDTCICDIHPYYQLPKVVPELQADSDKVGSPSDHKMVVLLPLTDTDNCIQREKKKVTYRPFTDKGFAKMEEELKSLDWTFVETLDHVNDQLLTFHQKVLSSYEESFVEKTRTFTTENQPWFSDFLNKLKRKKSREFSKHRMSSKYLKLQRQYRQELKRAKQSFYASKIKHLKSSDSKQWWTQMKKILKVGNKQDNVEVEEIKDLSDEEQVDIIAKHFAKVSQSYEPLNKEEINFPPFSTEDIPIIPESEVLEVLENLNVNKAGRKGEDVPARIYKHFAKYFYKPITKMLNNAIVQGSWPQFLKTEKVTPVPKVTSPKVLKDLRCISGLMMLSKIMEKVVCKMVLSDMRERMDPSQFAGHKGLSCESYLVKMWDRILSSLDTGDNTAVIVSLLDWADAFPSVQHTLGVQAFIDCGVRPSLMPLIADYFLDRSMVVQWHNTTSSSFKMPASTPQGSSFGVLEFLAISNDNSENVPVEDRYKYQDDLSILETVNLLSVGLASHNSKNHVCSSLPVHNQIVDNRNLQTQKYLHQISDWTKAKQMKLNVKKTKAMIINMSRKHQFTTSLQLNDQTIELIDKAKLLGLHLSNDLSWDLNTQHIVKNGNMRMQVLHTASKFTSSIKDLKIIYNQYVRSKLEYGSCVWHSGLTKKQSNDIERLQKSGLRVILGKNYTTYKKALKDLNMESLKKRRQKSCLKEAKKYVKTPQLKQLFPRNKSKHVMKRRYTKRFHVNKARTKRYKNSPVIYMQNLLNSHEDEKQSLLNFNLNHVSVDLYTRNSVPSTLSSS